MRRNLLKRMIFIPLIKLITLVLLLQQPLITYAGWKQIAYRWEYTQNNEVKAANTWLQIDNAKYYFGANGTMDTGWHQEADGTWYFLNPIFGENQGVLLIGWQWIDGRCYYLTVIPDEGHPLGSMYSGEMTPDGYSVNAAGAWTNEQGIEQYIPGKGILTFAKTVSSGKKSFEGGGGSGNSKPTPETPWQPSEPDKPEEPALPELPTEPEIPATPPNAEKESYTYTIRYKDIDTKATLAEVIGEAEKGSIIEIEQLDIDNYELCEGQTECLILEFDKVTEYIYYKEVTEASPSDAIMIDWQVKFTDAETHQKKISETRKGTIKEGGTLYVNYMETIIDEANVIWDAIESPPMEFEVYGTGTQIYYIEYEEEGQIPDEGDPEEELKKQLEAYIQEAKKYDSIITGEASEHMPDSRFLVSNQAQNDIRIKTLVNQITNTQTSVFYVIGKNYLPNGMVIAEYFGKEAEYSNTTEDVIVIGEDTYTVARMSITRNFDSDSCTHAWVQKRESPATCLGKGVAVYFCGRCEKEEETYVAALGHIDINLDTICDRCNRRTEAQELGSELQADISIEGSQRRNLTFVCIDADYQGGMLYMSKEVIPLNDFSGYGSLDYNESNIRRYFRSGFQNAFSIKGDALLGITRTDSSELDYAMILTKEEYLSYQNVIPPGSEFLTRTRTGNALVAVSTDGNLMNADPVASGIGIRPVILLGNPDAGEAEKTHWKIGDIQAQNIDGETYLFECIDQNYSDKVEMHQQSALFLCTTVIPADIGSKYEYERQGDGTYQYVFKPGPIVNFGTSNDYKYSNIRRWLNESGDTLYNIPEINIGVDYAYLGNTEEKRYGELDEDALRPYYIGHQKLTDKLFILSVDEAIKYKEYLWRFGGSAEENPETQYGSYKKGYWLRNPYGNSADYDTDFSYIVDVVNGNIHAQAIHPEGGTADEENNVTGTTGIRPAFTMLQN